MGHAIPFSISGLPSWQYAVLHPLTFSLLTLPNIFVIVVLGSWSCLPEASMFSDSLSPFHQGSQGSLATPFASVLGIPALLAPSSAHSKVKEKKKKTPSPNLKSNSHWHSVFLSACGFQKDVCWFSFQQLRLPFYCFFFNDSLSQGHLSPPCIQPQLSLRAHTQALLRLGGRNAEVESEAQKASPDKGEPRVSETLQAVGEALPHAQECISTCALTKADFVVMLC